MLIYHVCVLESMGAFAKPRPMQYHRVMARSEPPGRYVIREEIARGGMGIVYKAFDRALGVVVALKRPTTMTVESHERARREAAALRLLRVPGVVQLLDAGEDAQGAYLVTEFVDGQAFPGSVRGDRLVDVVVGVLEVLARVHAVGIVHRDLKPSNVLVDRDGRVHLLDFGIARGAVLGGPLTESGSLIGTPRYLSPEQLGGGRVDARTDLYALGLMVFEVLAGSSPFAQEVPDQTYSRLWRDPPPVASRAPGVSPALARLVDRLLGRRPDTRPGSAAEALSLLGRNTAYTRLKMIGRDRDLDALTEAARSGVATDVRSEPGHGRTRLLEEAARVLESEGRSVVWLVGAERPFESIRAAFELPREADPVACRAAICAHLAVGGAVVVDPPSSIDAWSFKCLADCQGAILGAGRVALEIGPVDERDQQGLFLGADKILHLREDGARELHRRSRGIPSRIAMTLAEWTEAGLARIEAGQVRLEPGAPLSIAELPAWSGGFNAGNLPDSPDLLALLPWVVLGDGELDIAALATLARRAEWEVKLLVDDLADRMLVDLTEAGRPHHRPGSEASLAVWTEEERRRAHRAIALLLPAGQVQRLRHLLQGGRPDEVAMEAREVARRMVDACRFGLACHVLDMALGLARWRVADDAETGLLYDYVIAAYSAEDPAARELAAVAVRRSDVQRLGLTAVQDIADAAVALGRRQFAVAEALLAEVGPQDHEDLEVIRVAMEAELAVLGHADRATSVVGGLRQWASERPERLGRWHGWMGLLAYHAADFDAAIAHHRAATRLRTSPFGRVSASVNLALALLDADAIEEAERVADQIIEDAGAARLGSIEARGWWIKRSAVYRRGAEDEVDFELIEAAASLSAGQAAPLLFNEGAIAWRLGQTEVATSCMIAARARWTGFTSATLACDAILAALGQLDGLHLDRLRREATDLPVSRANIQIKALAGLRPGARLPTVPGRRWEILSADEVRVLQTGTSL